MSAPLHRKLSILYEFSGISSIYSQPLCILEENGTRTNYGAGINRNTWPYESLSCDPSTITDNDGHCNEPMKGVINIVCTST